MRWHHPTAGCCRPDEFVALAEQTGLIGALTRLACWRPRSAQAAAWQEAGMPIAVAVNLSVRDLRDPQLPADRRGLLGQHGAAARARLLLEITESALMSDPDQALEHGPRAALASGSAWPSTTSARATRRWPTCAGSRSTS